jgi:hypothetical protein
MKALFLLLFCVYSFQLQSSASNLPELLLGGHVVDPTRFPEIVYIQVPQGKCTATIVGPRVVITAAHCVGHLTHTTISSDVLNGHLGAVSEFTYPTEVAGFKAVCYAHPYYPKRLDYDIAVCVSDYKFSRFASVATEQVRKGEAITLAGYGCTHSNGTGGNDGTLRLGQATITDVPNSFNKKVWFYAMGESALCYGDSGGPAIKTLLSDNQDMHHIVYGVNSRGDLRTVSLLTAVYVPQIKSWLKNFEVQQDVGICGYSLDCVQDVFAETFAPAESQNDMTDEDFLADLFELYYT